MNPPVPVEKGEAGGGRLSALPLPNSFSPSSIDPNEVTLLEEHLGEKGDNARP